MPGPKSGGGITPERDVQQYTDRARSSPGTAPSTRIGDMFRVVFIVDHHWLYLDGATALVTGR
jgi:hypothetical protein